MFEKMEAIVLRTQDYGETHKIVTLLTKERGKLGAIARGAKKPKSRMAAITQPFIHGEFLVQVGSGLGTIQQGDLVNSFRAIREDIVKTAFASYLAEMTDKLTDQHERDPYYFQQLVYTYDWIAKGKDPEILTIIYELKMFKKAGIAPILHACASCGTTSAPFSFSISEGGFLCSRCLHVDQYAAPLQNHLVKLLRIFAKVDMEQIGEITVKKENKLKLQKIMDDYYDKYGGSYLRSKKFLKQLDMLQ
ncbi:DNA repair protein RecO [Aquibacillus sp. 3ASR75-11]|uniref:DNA repair protein RecO n=1 Tax=Terrihalobacillus insolitus TaxID=2950438 RepID=A0A9X3WSJ3_9BACI|nr:DNA repair protein RecO [Terrihalobacillus insolitus]MDC3413357.1 DNA repair protein RecO [Terrihalobacillus insolitus]MDC3424940.1 DNA repair protein RecO [Terrihalobacillus insolitus]